jgi:hypothetical protein
MTPDATFTVVPDLTRILSYDEFRAVPRLFVSTVDDWRRRMPRGDV